MVKRHFDAGWDAAIAYVSSIEGVSYVSSAEKDKARGAYIAALSTPATLDNTAVEVEALRERIATLEAALAPFTRNHSSDEYLRSAEDDGLCAAYSFRAGDYRRARAALTAKTEKAE